MTDIAIDLPFGRLLTGFFRQYPYHQNLILGYFGMHYQNSQNGPTIMVFSQFFSKPDQNAGCRLNAMAAYM